MNPADIIKDAVALIKEWNAVKKNTDMMLNRSIALGGKNFFVATDGAFFRVGVFPGAMALVIEYADTEQEARQNALEDGDRFYLDETTLDEMLRLMIAEIERC